MESGIGENNVFSNYRSGHQNCYNYQTALATETETRDHHGYRLEYAYAPTSAAVTVSNEAFLTPPHGFAPHALINSSRYSLYGGDVSPLHPDPHLVCLKLGKRHYFEDSNPIGVGGSGFYSFGKRDKPSSSTAVVPRCQVEGCNVALVNAKDYHRRHKVCDMHSKAPKVVVLGIEQRFCQQCSRFHVLSEFDDSKRSCRRRLAGHNERRRKSTTHDSFPRSYSQDKMLTTGRSYSCVASPSGCALSLLSPKADSSSVSSTDLSSRSRAALHELIAEKRASIDLDRNWQLHSHSEAQINTNYNNANTSQQQNNMLAQGWDRFRFHETGSHVTLDLMQASSSAFGLLSMKGKTKEECGQVWNSMDGSRVI